MSQFAIDWRQITTRAVAHLQALIRIDSSNPPGDERAAADYIIAALTASKIELVTLEMAPRRANTIARINGTGEAEPLLVLTHLDVVPAGEGWTHPPFGGEIHDGHIWGRGAVDMKHIVAAAITVFQLLAQTQLPLRRDLIFAATADEETAGESGAGWLFRNYPQLVECEHAVSEGGDSLTFGGLRYLLIEAAEKGWLTVDLVRTSRSGHSSLPTRENCLYEIGRILTRLSESRFPHHVTTTAGALIEGLAQDQPEEQREILLNLLDPAAFESAVVRLECDPATRSRLEGLLHSHATPTITRGGESIWANPEHVTLTLAGRVLPGEDKQAWLNNLEQIIGPLGTHEVSSFDPGIENDIDTSFYNTLSATVARHNPDATILPTLMLGGGDIRHAIFRGATGYGFFPLPCEPNIPTVWELAHGRDERISITNLERCVRYLWDVICLDNELEQHLSPCPERA